METSYANVVTFKDINIYVGSWNVNGKAEVPESLSSWLNTDNLCNLRPHIVVIGIQEIISLSATNVLASTIVDEVTMQQASKWNTLLLDYLQQNLDSEFVHLITQNLIGIYLSIFNISSLLPSLKDIKSATVTRGIGGLGNKGAVCVRMLLEDSINDHDIILWLGDLNYRLEEGPSLTEIYEMIQSNDLNYLHKIDQLNAEKAAKRVFHHFKEGSLQFPPTYKFIPGLDIYDDKPDGKLRFPAWCDRILWRTGFRGDSPVISACTGYVSPVVDCGEDVELLSYNAGSNIISDHKPVVATLRVQIKSVNWSNREKFLLQDGESLLKNEMTTSASSSLSLPSSSLQLSSSSSSSSSSSCPYFDPSFLYLDESETDENNHYQIQLINRTSHASSFKFMQEFIPEWIKIQPLHGILAASSHIEITVTVVGVSLDK
eukprot:gene13002-27439_t